MCSRCHTGPLRHPRPRPLISHERARLDCRGRRRTVIQTHHSHSHPFPLTSSPSFVSDPNAYPPFTSEVQTIDMGTDGQHHRYRGMLTEYVGWREVKDGAHAFEGNLFLFVDMDPFFFPAAPASLFHCKGQGTRNGLHLFILFFFLLFRSDAYMALLRDRLPVFAECCR